MAQQNQAPNVILHSGRVSTPDRTQPAAEAVAIRDGRFVAVGKDPDVIALKGNETPSEDNGPLVGRLLQEALALLGDSHPAARARIEQASRLVGNRGGIKPPARGGLALWQVRRVEQHVRGNLGSSLRLDDLAALANLSSSYFSRAFKIAFGSSFSDYLIRLRIDHAKYLLLATDLPISEIALACGLADQAHLSRLFRRLSGMPPSAWRRRAHGDAPRRRRQDSSHGADIQSITWRLLESDHRTPARRR